MKKLLALLILFLLPLFLFTEVEAKVLPQAKKSVQKQSSTGSGIGVSPRLRADKKALIVSFSNLSNAKSVSYFLTYLTNTQQEGAGGSINLKDKTSERAELLFGTCSKNVCRYHTGIKNAKLEVTYTNKLGKKYIKRYKIKV